MQGELADHLARDEQPNRRNGKGRKAVKTSFGKIVIDTPRDRNSTFEPLVLPKRKTVLGEALDHKVLSLYSFGMSYHDICKHLDEMYGMTVAPSTLTAITDSILDDVKQWQSRPLETVYPFVWMDALHYKVKEEGSIKTKAVYCLLGVDREGKKDLLGLYINETEGAKFWLQVLSDLQN